jgi:hypothetical protein
LTSSSASGAGTDGNHQLSPIGTGVGRWIGCLVLPALRCLLVGVGAAFGLERIRLPSRSTPPIAKPPWPIVRQGALGGLKGQ